MFTSVSFHWLPVPTTTAMTGSPMLRIPNLSSIMQLSESAYWNVDIDISTTVDSSEITNRNDKKAGIKTTWLFGSIRKLKSLYIAGYAHMQHLTFYMLCASIMLSRTLQNTGHHFHLSVDMLKTNIPNILTSSISLTQLSESLEYWNVDTHFHCILLL